MMPHSRFAAGFVALLMVSSMASPSHAFFHLWDFSEFYSNADGSVQFVEMFSPSVGENVATGAEIRTDSNTFSFPGELGGSTANKHLLIATPGFETLSGGVTPDFTLPTTNFFDTDGDTIILFHPTLGEFRTKPFTTFPTDGVTSLNFPPSGGVEQTNSPTNYSNEAGSVDLSSGGLVGDYNGDNTVDAADYTVWRDTLGSTTDLRANGDDTGVSMNLIDEADYAAWKNSFGASSISSSSTAVPEPSAIALALISAISLVRRRRSETTA